MFAGVDGCRGGWLVALDQPPRLILCQDWSGVLASTSACRRIAVDMPVGLPAAGRTRACDREARRLLGPRRSCVFSAPERQFLNALDFAEVSRMSLQSFYLLPKIRELDNWIKPDHQARVLEAHPELVFARLAGRPLSESKKSPSGLKRRLELLGLEKAGNPWKRSLVGPDDVLDALAMLHCAENPGEPLGTGERDERGLSMQIYG